MKQLSTVLNYLYRTRRGLYALAPAWRKVEPNLTLLNAALKQTGWTGLVINQRNWRKELLKRLSDLDWKKARSDVNPFLENERDLSLVTKDTISHLLIKPASKHCNDVILSDAKNLAFSCCYEILHSVQDDKYNCRVNSRRQISKG